MSKEDKFQGRQDLDRRQNPQTQNTQTKLPRSNPDKEAAQHGIVRDAQGQEQPADKSRAQHVSRTDRDEDRPSNRKR